MRQTTQRPSAANARRITVAGARIMAGILMCLVGLAAMACGYDGPSLDVSNLKKKLDADPDAILVVDVRQRSLFEKGHIAGAWNVPLEEMDANATSLGATSRPLAVICARGVRSLEAVKKLRAYGLTPFLVVGGMNEWEKAGYLLEQ